MPVLGDGQTYQVKAKSIDMAGNESIMAVETFICDTTSPSTTIIDIDEFVNDLTSVSGSASDSLPGALKKVQVVFMNTTDSHYWNGSDWVFTETWL